MLQIHDVTIRFGDSSSAVQDVSLRLERQDRLTIIGETGSGKSVLLLAMLQLLAKSAHVSGKILYENMDLLRCTSKEIAAIRGSKISYIPQGSGNGLNPLYTIGHQMCEAIKIQGKLQKREFLPRAVSLLEQFGLSEAQELCRAYPFMLSGGMRQRVLIAMAIAADADLVLADEPTKGLDQHRIDMVKDAFQNLCGRTLLCVTHDLRFAKAISTKVAVMYASQLIESSDSGAFFASPLHPYSRAMLRALPENGLHGEMGFAPPREGEDAKLGCRFRERCNERFGRCEESPPLADFDGRKVRCWLYADAAEQNQ